MTNCKKCGKELGKRQTIFCSNACKLSDKDNIHQRTRKNKTNEKNSALKSKIDGKIINDVHNISGTVTRYLLKQGIDVGQNYHEYFDIIQLKEVPLYKSKYSDWTTKDLENKSGWITVEVKKYTTIDEHIKKYPEEAHLFKKDIRTFGIENNPSNHVECKICGKKLEIITVTHLQTHNITPAEYKLRFGFPSIVSQKSREKLQELYKSNDKINKIVRRSKPEYEIGNFLKENGIEYFNNSREFTDGHEVDFLIPDFNLAIEYNGLFFHSEIGGEKTKHYHLDKLNICSKYGIRLVTIFEDEWILNKEIVLSKLRNLLNLSSEKIYARKCVIKEIDSSVSNSFLVKTHLQGKCNSNIKLGAFFNDELIGVMTFSTGRIALGARKIENEYELVRYSTKLNTNCVGLFSKMLNHFIKAYSPNIINSYGDLRWTDLKNNVYLKNGFELSIVSKPNYWYMNGYSSRIHRYNFPKHKLIEMGAEKNKSEWEIMKEFNYDRIWDCGNGKYTLKLNK